MNTIQILIAESKGFSPEAAWVLQNEGSLVQADLNRAGLVASVATADVLWVRLRHFIDAEVMEAAPRLQAIVSPTTGLNHIDLAEAKRRDIRVFSLRGEIAFLKDIRATAEHTIGLIFGLLRHLPAATTHVRSGGWNRDLFSGRELHQKTVGVVGYGRLGRIVARYLKVFEARVLASDPAASPENIEEDVTLLPLSSLLEQSDIVTLHVNLCAATQGFFGVRQFENIKEGAWFINTSRGELLDENALLASLESGRLSGAALDVLCNERSAGMANHPLVEYAAAHDNLLITPHLGGGTFESMQKTEVFLAQRVADWLRKGVEERQGK